MRAKAGSCKDTGHCHDEGSTYETMAANASALPWVYYEPKDLEVSSRSGEASKPSSPFKPQIPDAAQLQTRRSFAQKLTKIVGDKRCSRSSRVEASGSWFDSAIVVVLQGFRTTAARQLDFRRGAAL